MKNKTAIFSSALLFLVTANVFAENLVTEKYENRIQLNLSGAGYERLKKDAMYVGAGVYYNPFFNSAIISGKTGYNFPINEKLTFTPFASLMFSNVDGSCDMWGGAGIKINQNISHSFSIGAVVEGVSVFHEKGIVTGASIPLTFHLGEKRNWEIEVAPGVGAYFTHNKNKAFPALSIAAGYRF